MMIAQVAISQSTHVRYTYDSSGNRVSRKLTTVSLLKKANGEENEQEPVTESWEDREIKIYPNPTKGAIKISITGGDVEDEYAYMLYTSEGKKILQGEIDHVGEHPIDLSPYPSGMYMLMLYSQGEKKVIKVIKE